MQKQKSNIQGKKSNSQKSAKKGAEFDFLVNLLRSCKTTKEYFERASKSVYGSDLNKNLTKADYVVPHDKTVVSYFPGSPINPKRAFIKERDAAFSQRRVTFKLPDGSEYQTDILVSGPANTMIAKKEGDRVVVVDTSGAMATEENEISYSFYTKYVQEVIDKLGAFERQYLSLREMSKKNKYQDGRDVAEKTERELIVIMNRVVKKLKKFKW